MKVSNVEDIREERKNLYMLAKETAMTEKELKYRQMQRKLLEDYLHKGDFSKSIDFSVLGEEYIKLRNECEVYGEFKQVRKIMAQGKIDLKKFQRAMRNPDRALQKKSGGQPHAQ